MKNIYKEFLSLLGFESNANNTVFKKHDIIVIFGDAKNPTIENMGSYIIETTHFIDEPLMIVNCYDYKFIDGHGQTPFEVFVNKILYVIASYHDLEDIYSNCISDVYDYTEEESVTIAFVLYELGFKPDEFFLNMCDRCSKEAIFDLSSYKEVAFISEQRQYTKELVGEAYWDIYKDRTYTDRYYRINKTNKRIDMRHHDWIINMIKELK